MKTSVIIPAYNEINTIEEIIRKVKSVPISKEIIIVDDSSTDGTREFLEEYDENPVRALFHSKNQGKGAAIRTGLAEATGDIVIIQDADLEYDPMDYPKLIEPIVDGREKVVFGNRYHDGNNMFFSRYKVGVILLTKVANALYGIKISDEATCYKVFHREVVDAIHLKCKRFEFCPEITAKVAKAGYHIHEVPIKYQARSIEEGKKIGWRDAFEAFYTLIKYRFVK